MKKNILLVLSIFLSVSFGFISCSNDDNDDNGKTDSSGTIKASRNYSTFIDYSVVEIKATYTQASKLLNLQFGLVDVKEVIPIADKGFTFKLNNIDIENIKSNTEIQDKISKVDYNDYTEMGHNYENYINGGKLIIKSIDLSNKKITIEFQNLDIWRDQYYLNGNNEKKKEIMLKEGSFEFPYTIK